MDKITNIAVTVTAIDSDGKPVYAVAEYYNPRGWIAGGRSSRAGSRRRRYQYAARLAMTAFPRCRTTAG